MKEFRTQTIEILEGPDEGVSHERIYVFFSGGWQQAHGYCFENTGKAMGYKSIWVRDLSTRWYCTPDYPAALEALGETLRDWTGVYDGRVVFCGLSMGGYGALKFGADLLPDRIICFAPQTEWENIPDIAPAYATRRAEGLWCPEIFIHLCRTSNQKLDHPHARRLEKDAGARIIVHECDRHNVAGELRKQGRLMEVLEGFS